MVFLTVIPQIPPYDSVSLLSVAQGATRALQWKCAFPFLVAGGALRRTQRHLGQTRIEQLLATPTSKMIIFAMFIRYFTLQPAE